MKKGLLSIPVAGVVVTLVVLGTSAAKPWSWDYTKNNKKINYCLLIGQTDHNDSQARTKGVRSALGTRPKDVAEDSNPNTETPVAGKMKFTFEDRHTEIYNVEELEHKVCVADSGATWDQSTAINTCNTWYAKYQGKLTMMVSNNDGMAEGALYSSNSPKGIPIFGYDSNTSTLNLLKEGRIAGTINSNAPAQAAIMNILACRILDGTYVWNGNNPEEDWINVRQKLLEGILLIDRTTKQPIEGVKMVDEDGHYVKKKDITTKDSGFLTDILGENIPFFYEKSNHSLYVNSNKVIAENVDDFRVDVEEQAHKIGAVEQTTRQKGKYNIFYNTYSRTDTYLQGTMIPLVKQFRNMFAIENTNIVDGNGNDDKEVLDAIKSAGDKFDAYIVNMTKTETAEDYIKTIKGIVGETKFKKMPIIFYNRQPFKNGAIDSKWMVPETNGGNPYVYYVGFDAEAGAQLQGEMIVEWLAKQAGAEKGEAI